MIDFFIILLLIGSILFVAYRMSGLLLRADGQLGFLGFITVFMYRVGMVFMGMFVLTGGCIAYQDVVSPGTLPFVTVSNGETTLFFETTAHFNNTTIIGSSRYVT